MVSSVSKERIMGKLKDLYLNVDIEEVEES